MPPAAMGIPRWCSVWFKEGFTVALGTLARTRPLLWTAHMVGRNQDTEFPRNKCMVEMETWRTHSFVNAGGFGVLRSQGRHRFAAACRELEHESERPFFPIACPSPVLLELGYLGQLLFKLLFSFIAQQNAFWKAGPLSLP